MLLIQMKRWLIAIALCVLIAAILGWIKYSQISAAIAYAESFPEPSATVEAETVRASLWQPTISVLGTVVPKQSVEIRNEFDGIIEEVGYQPGGKVKKGQVILRLNTDDEQAQLDAIAAEVELAKLEMTRYEKLDQLNLSSRNEFDRAKAQLAVSEANARSLQTIIERNTLVAPFDATAGLHEFEPGAYLPGNSLVARLIGSLDQIWIDFYVPQEQAGIAIGTSIELELENSGGKPETIKAEIIAKDAELSQISRNIRIRALADNTQARLTPGAIVALNLPKGAEQSVVRLPSSAIRYQASGSYVHLLVEDGDKLRAQSQPVELAGEDNQDILIASGVTGGQLVATLGSFKLRDGLLVTVASGAADMNTGDTNTDDHAH